MKLILAVLIVGFALTIVSVIFPQVRIKKGTIQYYPNHVMAMAVIGLIAAVAGLRSNIGDTQVYMESYRSASDQLTNYLKIDGAFDFIFIYCLRRITENPQIMIAATSLVIYPCILWRLYKNSALPEMSIFLFFTLGCYVNSMNGIRQYLVSSVLFALYPFMLKLKKPYVVILLLILSSIHSTALVLIPVYLVIDWKPWSRKMLFVIGVIAVIFLLFSRLSPFMYQLMEGTKYGEYENAEYTMQKVNMLRIAVTGLPVLLCWLIRSNFKLKGREMNFLVNACLFNFVFMAFGLYGASYARFSLYFELYPLLIYPVIARAGFLKERDSRLFSVLLYLVFSGYFFYQIYGAWGGLIYISKALGVSID